jgi:hypothetical protein
MDLTGVSAGPAEHLRQAAPSRNRGDAISA